MALKGAVATIVAVVFWAAPWGGAEPQSDLKGGGRNCLWRVSSSSTAVFILGSVHLMKPDAKAFSPVIEEAFEGSEIAVFEVDLGAEGSAEAALFMLSAGALPAGSSLSDVVSPETYRLAADRLGKAGMDITTMQKMRPWMIATTVALDELQRAGYSPTGGVDRHFYSRAVDDGLTIRGLETVRSQLELFRNLTPAQDEAFLVQTIKDLDAVIPMADELIGHWRAGRIDELTELLADGYDEFPDLFTKLVIDRNRNWMPVLEELLSGSHQAFVVVGALHVVGDGGLAQMLEEKGYRVEQL